MDNGDFDIGAVVNRLMSDPKVADLIKGLKEGEEAKTEEPSAANEGKTIDVNRSDIYQKLPDIINSLSKDGGQHHGNADTEKRNRLLSALKPYLSANRQGMIDSIMSYSKLASLLDLFPDKK